MKNKGMTVIEALVGLAICAIIITMCISFFAGKKYKTGDRVVLKGSGDIGVIISVLTDNNGDFPLYKYSILVKDPRTYTVIVDRDDISKYEGVERE